jgi:perosamine synthetase
MKSAQYLKTIFKLWSYKKGPCVEKLRKILAGYLHIQEKNIFLFENGRTAQYIYLKSLNLKEGERIAVQGFTCNPVINPILWLKLKPLYIDIDPMTLNMSLDCLTQRVEKDTKVVILQHTFGNPVFKTKKEFVSFVKKMHKKNILVFEDCAHCLGGEIEGKKLGTFGDAALISFGFEKVLSTRVGGALVVNRDEDVEKIQSLVKDLKVVGCKDTFLWLLNPFFWRMFRFFKKDVDMAVFFKNLKLLNMGFSDSELVGIMPKKYPRRISNALSCIVLEEIKGLSENLLHRKEISEIYGEYFSVEHLGGAEIPFVKFPIVCETKRQKEDLVNFLNKKNIKVGNWYEQIVYPKSTDLGAMMYETGSCKIAEIISSRILNLPTGKNISSEYAREISEQIISFFDEYENSRNK